MMLTDILFTVFLIHVGGLTSVKNNQRRFAPTHALITGIRTKAHAQFLDAFDAAETGREVGTEKATVGGLVREAAYSTQAQVDGA
jgi:hypothetical protein